MAAFGGNPTLPRSVQGTMRRTTTLLAVLLALAVAGLAACGDDEADVATGSTATSTPPTSTPPDPATPEGELAAAEQRWADTRIVDYAMAYDVVCFCPQISVSVQVGGGEVVDTIVDAPGFQGDPSQLVDEPLTVEDMFAELRAAYEGGAASVQVTYDPDTGRPLDYFIDEDEMIADEEHGVTVSSFSALDPDVPPTTGTTIAPLNQQLGRAQLTDTRGCGTTFAAADPDGTVLLELTWEGEGAPPAQVALPDPSWSAEVQVGRDLFANWCDDVLEPDEPLPQLESSLEVVGGTLAIAEPPPATSPCPSAVTATATDLAVALPDGSTTTWPEIALANEFWGCFPG